MGFANYSNKKAAVYVSAVVDLQVVTKTVSLQPLDYTDMKNKGKDPWVTGPQQDRYRPAGGF